MLPFRIWLRSISPYVSCSWIPTTSDASRLIGNDFNAMAASFIDRSMIIRDLVTPSNAYAGDPANKLTFSRSSVKNVWRFGTMTSISVNELPYDYDPVTNVPKGLLLEPSRTNLLLNSATLSTQSVTVSTSPYALSFYGTGSITLSGAYSGVINGTGALQRAVSVFTPAAGSVTLTVSGSVNYAQLEAASGPSSWITTTGATVTRQADNLTHNLSIMPWSNSAATLLMECSASFIDSTVICVGQSVSDGTTSERSQLHVNGTSGPGVFIGQSGATQMQANFSTPVVVADTPYRVAVAYQANDGRAAYGNTLSSADTVLTVPTVTQVRYGGISSVNSFTPFHLRKIAMWCGQRKIDAIIQSLTIAA